MRKVIYGGASSLDGFLAAADGSVDWLHWSDDVTKMISQFWTTTDTLLMGRKTWEVAAANASADSGAMTGMKSYVFSRTLRTIDRPGVELVHEDAGGFVRALKKKKGKHITVLGGGDLARSLFEADVIDEVGLNIHPVLLGSGAPAFLAVRRIGLELTECRQIHGGCVFVNYRVKHSRRSRR
jgi:dihydrofolate reductase